MVHTKWFIMAAGLALLTACSNDNAEPSAENDSQNGTEEAVEETAEDTASETAEETEKAEEEEVAEEQPEEAEEDQVSEPRYRINTANWKVEPISDAPEEAVLITIDDAPDKHAAEMAETLKELGVPAIFFVNGHFLDSDEEKENLKKIHDMGFMIGNHTNTHANLQTISEEEQREEIIQVSDAVEEIIGERPKFFRAPHGANTEFSNALVEEEGMVRMNWTYGYDFTPDYMEKEVLTDIMVNTELLANGGNLLMHDREWTAAALPDIIEGLSDKGYGFIDPAEIEGAE